MSRRAAGFSDARTKRTVMMTLSPSFRPGASGYLARAAAALTLAALVPLAGCTSAQRQGEATSYVIVDQITAASGATPAQFSGTLASDVQTMVKVTENGQQVKVPTIFEDDGRATFELALKDPGSTATPNTPSTTNTVTFTRYHVQYVRADGRNTPGVDVPYAFDGGLTVSVSGGNTIVGEFVLVRAQAKMEAPLLALVGGGGAVSISTIAQVTFYGTDQAGRSVTATGNINVIFDDWGDPQ
jgi:hypothetical protein